MIDLRELKDDEGILLSIERIHNKNTHQVNLVFATNNGLRRYPVGFENVIYIIPKTDENPMDFLSEQGIEFEDVTLEKMKFLDPPKEKDGRWVERETQVFEVSIDTRDIQNDIDKSIPRGFFHTYLDNVKYEVKACIFGGFKFFSLFRLKSKSFELVEELPEIGLERIEYFRDLVLPNIRIISLDIEAIRPDGNRAFPQPGEAEVIITQYVIHDGLGKILKEGEIISEHGKIPKTSKNHVEIIEFLMDSYAVHFIGGHNVQDFDYKHLKFFGLKYRAIPFDTLKIARYHNRLLGAGPEGRVPNSLLDLKSICYHKRIISSGELPEINRADMRNEWVNRPDAVIDYSRIDRKMTYGLVKETFPPSIMLASVMNFGVYHTITSPTGGLSEFMAMRYAKKRNLIIPRRFRSDELDVISPKGYGDLSLQAAIVLQPNPGLYENVTWGDFSALYPSIMVQKGICPTTICCEHEECKHNGVEIVLRRGSKKDHQEIKYWVWFCTKRKGIYPEFIEDYRSARMELKKIKKSHKDKEIKKLAKVLDISIKVPANSCFGQLASRYGRSGTDIRCSAAITAFGREILQDSWATGDRLGYKTIYGDTDSGGIHDPKTGEYPGEEVVEEIQKEIQERHGENIYFDFDGDYPKIGFSGKKKRYVKMDKDGNISFKGFDEIIKRNSIGLVFRLALREIYIRLLKREEWIQIYEDLRKSMRQGKYIGEMKEIMKREKIEPTDITRQTRVKPPFTMKSKFNRFGFLLVNRELGISVTNFKNIMANENLKEKWHKTYRRKVGIDPVKIDYYEIRGKYKLIEKFKPSDLAHLDSTKKVYELAKSMEELWYTKMTKIFDFPDEDEVDTEIREDEVDGNGEEE